MDLRIKYLNELNGAEIYSLLENVYSTTDSMSEEFHEKFPDIYSCIGYFEEILRLPGGVVLFLEFKGLLCGYVSVKPRHQAKIKHTSELNMGIHSEFRGKGIGKFLLQNAVDRVQEEGIIEIIYLMVRSDNVPAISLYEKSGFEKLAVLEKDTKIGNIYLDGILMRKFTGALNSGK